VNVREHVPPLISLCLPTRGRPKMFAAMANSAIEHAERPDLVEVVFYTAHDDELSGRYPSYGQNITRLIGPPIWNSHAWNECAHEAAGDILMQAGDDLMFRTPGWDTAVRLAFAAWPDRIGLVHCADGSYHDEPADRVYPWGSVRERFAAHVIVHRRWYAAVGYLVPPMLASTMTDFWVNELADLIGRRAFLPNVLVEHLHPTFRKRERDATDERRWSQDQYMKPSTLYADPVLAARRAADADRLQGVMNHVEIA
jgi:hypothetical protein